MVLIITLTQLSNTQNKSKMPELIEGILYEQKVSTVANNDTAMNDEITLQAADDWVLSQIIISGSDAILLFSRQSAIVLP